MRGSNIPFGKAGFLPRGEGSIFEARGFSTGFFFFDGIIVIDIEYLDSRTLCNIWQYGWFRKILEKCRF